MLRQRLPNSVRKMYQSSRFNYKKEIYIFPYISASQVRTCVCAYMDVTLLRVILLLQEVYSQPEFTFSTLLVGNITPLEIKVDGIRYMCNAHCLMTCTAPRGKPYEKKKDPYEGGTRQVMGRKNAYGPARKAYYLMRVRSVRKIQKHNSHLIKWLLNELGRIRSYILLTQAKYFPVRPSASVNKYILL